MSESLPITSGYPYRAQNLLLDAPPPSTSGQYIGMPMVQGNAVDPYDPLTNMMGGRMPSAPLNDAFDLATTSAGGFAGMSQGRWLAPGGHIVNNHGYPLTALLNRMGTSYYDLPSLFRRFNNNYGAIRKYLGPESWDAHQTLDMLEGMGAKYDPGAQKV